MIITNVFYRMIVKEMGRKCTICKPMHFINPRYISMGNHVRVREFARVEAIVKYGEKNFRPHIVIGDDTGFEQGLHLTCGNSIVIGKDCVIMPYVLITDLTHEYIDLNTNVLNQELIADSVEIGDGCLIGSGARIMPGAILGCRCNVGANAVVVKGNYKDYSVLIGAPARCIKRYGPEEKKWKKTFDNGDFKP